ncbi:MAG: hypothetical protein JRG95_06975 [Deltaproteobacteria bacterium]|nr:hypothetical protein [Deltaproteobacteria bacterium]
MPGKLARASLALALILLIGAALARPARATLGRPLADQGPTEVRVMMIVLDIDEIDAVAQSFIANVYYEARWHDPRLAHPGPQERVVPLNEIWHPRLQYLNQQRTIQTLPAIADIQPDGEVIVRQRVWGPFSQALEVEDFPFDQHRFSVVLIAAGFEADEVLLVVDPQHASAISRELSVPDWAISELSAGPVEHRFYEGAPPIPAFSDGLLVGSLARGNPDRCRHDLDADADRLPLHHRRLHPEGCLPDAAGQLHPVLHDPRVRCAGARGPDFLPRRQRRTVARHAYRASLPLSQQPRSCSASCDGGTPRSRRRQLPLCSGRLCNP